MLSGQSNQVDLMRISLKDTISVNHLGAGAKGLLQDHLAGEEEEIEILLITDILEVYHVLALKTVHVTRS